MIHTTLALEYDLWRCKTDNEKRF